MIIVVSLICIAALAYANGANDNFKGVATLFGSGVSDYRRALNWATAMAIALASALYPLLTRPRPVCGNTADMISKTRYSRHFRVVGDKATHYGLFDCGPIAAAKSTGAVPGACC